MSRMFAKSIWILIASMLTFACLASAEESPSVGCSKPTTNNLEQLLNLSKLIDPSGKLNKLIADFNSTLR